MSTNDVPGAKSSNNDKLSRGCWAEHDDGSLIYVKDIDENDRVIFEIYDLVLNPPAYYPHALAKTDFEKKFSYRNKNDIKWTWHDKTAFPWDKIMQIIDTPLPVFSAADQISAAERVANSLRARMHDLNIQHVENLSGQKVLSRKQAKKFMNRIKEAIMDMVE